MSGRKNPRTGGVLLAKAGSKEELSAILEADPFRQNGAAEYEIIEFIPTNYDKRFACFIEE